MAAADNVLHRELAPGLWWTTNNMREAIPGVPTPLTWSIWESGSLTGAAEMMYRMGTATAEEAPRLAPRGFSIVYGRPVACVSFTMTLMSRLPGSDPEGFTEASFGVPRGTIEFERLEPLGPEALARYAETASTQVERTRQVAREVRAEWERLTATRPSANGSLDVVQRGVELYRRAYTEHLLMTSLAFGVFSEVAALAASAGYPGLERRLLTGHGDMEETRIAEDLWTLGQGALTVEEFLARHGYHGPSEGEVLARSWRETPSVIEDLGTRYGAHGSENPTLRLHRQSLEREQVEQQLLDSLPENERESAREVLARARSWVPAREIGKGAFLMGLDVVRAGARVLGADLAARGVLRDPDHVFMFSFEELADLVDGAADIGAMRAALRADYETTDVPSVFEGTPPRLPLASTDETSPPEVRGIPVSPGQVTGRVRVLVDPANASPVEPGEVLVCATTDPSWVSLFLDAAALVIDIGQTMSHGAIVARELGIPCVIDTKTGTQQIPDGATVEVDGDTGVVRILDRAAPSTAAATASA